MSDSLIINARSNLRWHQRLFSDTSTAMMWGGWLYLWRPFLSAFGLLSKNFEPVLSKLLGASPMGFEYSVVALVGGSGTLLLWNMLPARKAKAAKQAKTLRDYASHFQLPEQDIVNGRNAAVSVIYHDAEGRIVGIQPQA